MNHTDRKAWKSARVLGDLGELVIRWLNGELRETPDHMGPPEAETIPLTDALTVINRGGFITVMSQLAETRDGESWNTWVDGFANDAVLQALREVIDGSPLILTACRRSHHEHERNDHWWPGRCQWHMVTNYWAERCPSLARELRNCWLVSVEDPEPGRNDLLWDTITRALAGETS